MQPAEFGKFATALALAKEEGIGNVTARKLAAKIGCSTQPIFRVYANMGELCGDINQKAAEVFSDYYENYESEVDTPFIHLGLAYIDFAKEESKLFQLLFMRKTSGNIGVNRILPEIDDNYTDILKSITDEYPVSADDAVILYRHLWIYSHGIATLCATSMCRFTEVEIGIMLTEVFKALLTERLKGKS